MRSGTGSLAGVVVVAHLLPVRRWRPGAKAMRLCSIMRMQRDALEMSSSMLKL